MSLTPEKADWLKVISIQARIAAGAAKDNLEKTAWNNLAQVAEYILINFDRRSP